MRSCIADAKEEIKRVDHLIYVSLKYTRTIDVIKNIINRFISTYDCLMLALLKKLQEEGKIEKIPESPVQKANTIKEHYDEPLVRENMDLYLLYRKTSKADCKSAQEYRRHVTMKCTLPDGKELEINIDKIYEYYKQAKEFFEYVNKLSGADD